MGIIRLVRYARISTDGQSEDAQVKAGARRRTREGVPEMSKSDTSLPPIANDLEVLQSIWERRAQLYLQHPDESPALIGVLPYLIHPPSNLSSTASWVSFRDKTLLPMIQHRPDDPNLPNFLKQVEAILAWRAAVPPEDRFWKVEVS
jgi:hypothetical protein